MKTKIGILVLALCTSFFSLQAQRRVTTARAMSYDISDNLDLDAVASIFGDSENLEDFERRLNDPDNRISNLDLNEDGYIDYLRVLENSSDRNSLVVIQAILDNDVYQDVATIEIEKVSNGNLRVQIVGDSYIYGSNYIIEPVFVRTPSIFSFFWGPRYRTYHSPYYWDYYPSWYSYYRPYSPFRYQRHVYVHINRYNTYHHTTNRNIYFSGDNYNHIRRNDYATRYPNRAFESRNQGAKNRYELNERRSGNPSYSRSSNEGQRSNERNYQNRQSNPSRSEGQRDVNENRRRSSQEKSGQTQPREYNRDSNTNKPETNDRQVEQKNDNRSGSYDKRPASESRPESTPERKSVSTPERRSVSTPERSEKRIESPQRTAAPKEKSGSVSGQSRSNRSNSEVKQNSRSEKRAEPQKREDNKENETKRRR